MRVDGLVSARISGLVGGLVGGRCRGGLVHLCRGGTVALRCEFVLEFSDACVEAATLALEVFESLEQFLQVLRREGVVVTLAIE